LRQKLIAEMFGFETFWQKDIGKKRTRKMWIKFTPGVIFTNILRAAFLCGDPKSPSKTDGLTVFFALLGSARIKVAHVKCWWNRLLEPILPNFFLFARCLIGSWTIGLAAYCYHIIVNVILLSPFYT